MVLDVNLLHIKLLVLEQLSSGSHLHWPGHRSQAALLWVLRPVVPCSDHIWGNVLSETITQCLRKQLEQLQSLTEALGRLKLSSSPGGSGEPPVTSPFPVTCVCYGLGNFASCATARSQLAFMLLFLEKCQVSFVVSCAWHGGGVPELKQPSSHPDPQRPLLGL